MANKTDKNQRANNDRNMSVWEHLHELRAGLVVIAVTYVAAVLGCYYFAPQFITYAMSLAKGYFFVQTGVSELLAQYIKVSLIAAFVVDSPIIIWQIVKFVGPGLKRSEEARFLLVLFAGLILFALGALFATFVVIPFTLQFFLSLNTVGIGGMYSIKEYVGYIVSLLFSFGLIFEIPVVAAILTSFGLLRPQWMRGGRRIVIVLCLICGAIITPPDIASQVMVAIPMYVLFEISVLISAAVYQKRRQKLIAQGIDPEENDRKEKEKRAKSSRWAAAKAAVGKKDSQKSKE